MITATATASALPLASGDRYLELVGSSPAALEAILRRGETPDPDALVGWEYRGANTPAFARLLGVQKFVKGFARGEGGLYGYNRRVRQDGLARPWLPGRLRFGFYAVTPVDPESRDNAYLNALLLDYGCRNFRLDPQRMLRDYIVRVEPGSDHLLLGAALLALGPARVPVSTFVLERLRPAP